MSDRRPVNILLVDDQPQKLLSYEVILAELGENLIRANSATEALDQLLRNEIAVLLVDVCMPDTDGFELAAMVRDHPRFQRTAIILVSGILVDDVDRLKGYSSGAVDYVSVPIVPEILRAKVAVFADLYRKNEELEQLNRELEQRVAERTREIEAAMAEAQAARRDAERANRLKDEFLATLSHELRTPLNAISGWAHLLRTGKLAPEQHARAVETISRNAELQSQLISEILDVSRIVTGNLRLDRHPLDLRGVVEAAIDTMRPSAAAKTVELEQDLGGEEMPVHGDTARLQQVVWNLLSNAIKFTGAGGHVEVRLAAAGPTLVLTVRDDGPGIAPEFLPYVFDRFRQGDSSSTRPHQGLGLGLAIVRHLVESHGGSVSASNRLDRSGAELVITLPRAAATLPGAVEREDDVGPEALRGVRVLVVDDEADGREVVATILRRCGAEPSVAASAEEAVQLTLGCRPDVVLTDIEMPGEDGYSLLRRVRALPAPESATPIAALTAYAGPQDRARMLDAGFERHISKPVRPAELVAAVAELCPRPARSEWSWPALGRTGHEGTAES